MYECYIENDVVIKEINHISYLSSGIPEDSNQVMIDIINIKELESYITAIKEEHLKKISKEETK